MPGLKVFASFDCEHDADLLNKLVSAGKAVGSNFTVIDRSCHEIASEENLDDLRERISKADAVYVLCGVWSHLSANVNTEVKIAQEVGKRYYLIKGRAFRECSRPATARISDKIYRWSKETLQQLILRNI